VIGAVCFGEDIVDCSVTANDISLNLTMENNILVVVVLLLLCLCLEMRRLSTQGNVTQCGRGWTRQANVGARNSAGVEGDLLCWVGKELTIGGCNNSTPGDETLRLF
jgi:hypothetical protein